MPSMLAFAAPLAMILPILGQGPSVALTAEKPVAASDAEKPARTNPKVPVTRTSTLPVSASSLDAFYDRSVARQVRIEQRVIVRISPQRSNRRQSLLADLPQQELTARYEERKMDKCLPVERIAGVQTGRGNRLLLFLRDRRIISVNLEKACLARDFYSGFYVEKNDDGQLCVDRDKLQSRTGVTCEVERMRQLVAVQD